MKILTNSLKLKNVLKENLRLKIIILQDKSNIQI